MSEIIPMVAAVLSLLLIALYGVLSYRRVLRTEHQIISGIESLTGLGRSEEYSIEAVLREVLERLVKGYNSPKGTLEFHSKSFGDFSFVVVPDRGPLGLQRKLGIPKYLRFGSSARGVHDERKRLAFIIDDDRYSCCLDVTTGRVILNHERLYMQELIREKVSNLLLDKLYHETASTPTDIVPASAGVMGPYKKMLDAARRLFVAEDLKPFLTEIQRLTQADGAAVMIRGADDSRFGILEKVGSIVEVPKSILEGTESPGTITCEGCVSVPIKTGMNVTGFLLAMNPKKGSIGLIQAAAGLLETFRTFQDEKNEMHSREVNILAEARRLEAADKMKSQFLANMSHEIRTPLNSIIGFAEILYEEHDTLSEKLFRDFSANIVSAGKDLLNLINDVLDITKMETGKMELDSESFSIHDVIESTRRTLIPQLGRRLIHLDVDVDDRLDILNADPVKFKQILYNILSNAIKYSPDEGMVKLKVVQSGNGIEMRISDNGVGIKHDDLGKLFHPFAQLDTKHGGTGLGLALTKKLVELHNGSIRIDSIYGSGTTVIVYLPLFQTKTDLTESSLLAEMSNAGGV